MAGDTMSVRDVVALAVKLSRRQEYRTMDRDGISNIYLNHVLGELLQLENYYGCWSADNIPVHTLEREPKVSFICNLARSGEKGTHFIACYASSSRGPLTVYDSFARQISAEYQPGLIADLKKIRSKLVFLPKLPVQHEDSNFCGFFAMLVILRQSRMSGGQSLLRFQRKNLMQNDRVCIKNITAIISRLNE
jgi:hypothetical protein